MLHFLSVILASWCWVSIEASLYKGDKIYRVELKTSSDVEKMFAFWTETRDLLDYWQTELHPGGHVDLRVPESQETLLSDIKELEYSVKIPDVEDLLKKVERQSFSRHHRRKRSENAGEDKVFDYTAYNSAAATHRELYRLANLYPNLTRLIGVGSTHHGRPLIVIEIVGTAREKNIPMVWIDGGLHAREWITVASSMYFIRELLEGYGRDDYITNILDNVKFAIQPLANPDGYAYSWNGPRLWRKNTAPTKVAWCKGVDLNRNFDINFGGPGASDFSCSEVYSGASAFSENESQAIARYLSAVRHKLMAYFSLHSYGQMWLTPLSYTKKKVSDRPHHMEVAEYATQSIKQVSGHRYTYGPSTALMYVTSGDSSDWVYTVLNCSHTYGIELGDNGKYGFLLPAQYIAPTGEDVLTGILSAVEVINSQPFNFSKKLKRKYRRKRKKFLS